MAKRYGIEISKYDYQRLKNDNLLTLPMVKFLLHYLKEKQSYANYDRLRRHRIRILYLQHEFYQCLSGNNYNTKSAIKINLTEASRFTSKFIGSGHTIFDLFDQIFVVLLKPHNQIALGVINLAEKNFTFYDCSYEVQEKVAANNQVLVNLSRFL